MAVRTIYVEVHNRKGRRLGVAALKSLARDVARQLPPWAMSIRRGDYVAGGTRFDLYGRGGDERHREFPVLKVRGDERALEMVIRLVGATHIVSAIVGHDRITRYRLYRHGLAKLVEVSR